MTAAALRVVHRELFIGSYRKSYVFAFMPVISAAEFIELVNPRLPSHHVFKAGKRVFLVTPASADTGATKIDFSPRRAGRAA